MRLRICDAHGLRDCITVKPGVSFLEAIWLSGKFNIKSFCGGNSLCGKCKILFKNYFPNPVASELKLFKEEEIQAGWRLACKQIIPDTDNGEITVELPKENFIEEYINKKTGISYEPVISSLSDSSELFVMGIDLGTTTIAWEIASFKKENLAHGTILNPQAMMGPDIISRLNSAFSGNQKKLSWLIWEIIIEILKKQKLTGKNIVRICIAGNSAQISILLNKKIDGLCFAPYKLHWHGGEIINVLEVGIPVIIPPLPGPFVGGDLSAGIYALQKQSLQLPLILADLGTNGEFVLLTENHQLFFTSIPMGPALETTGPKFGRLPDQNVAVSFKLSSSGLLAYNYDNLLLENPEGISATGYISLMALLFKGKFLNANGSFNLPEIQNSFLIKKGYIYLSPENTLYLNPDRSIYLTSNDVERLLFIKAAFRACLESIMHKVKLSAEKIKNFCLAGTLGQFVNLSDLSALGFFSANFLEKTVSVGNTSLKGALLLALNPDDLSALTELCLKAVEIDLANSSFFQTEFFSKLHWGN